MKILRALLLVTLALLCAGASAQTRKPADTIERQRARSPLGLLIVSWTGAEGRCHITLRNITPSTQRFDCHKLRGVVEQTGAIETAGDVVFHGVQKASLLIEPGASRSFTVTFPGNRGMAALSWEGSETWSTPAIANYKGQLVASPQAALELLREQRAEIKADRRERAHKAMAREVGIPVK